MRQWLLLRHLQSKSDAAREAKRCEDRAWRTDAETLERDLFKRLRLWWRRRLAHLPFAVRAQHASAKPLVTASGMEEVPTCETTDRLVELNVADADGAARASFHVFGGGLALRQNLLQLLWRHPRRRRRRRRASATDRHEDH
jgi:hypothetical protein